MNRKIPPDAFDLYVSLGVERSYKEVATRYGVSKAAVVNLAKRESWQQRLQSIEAKARHAGEAKAVESLQAATERHMKAMRVIQAKGLEALQTKQLETGMDAVRALDLGVRGERLILGEPSDRTALSVEDIRQRYERWTREAEEFCSNGDEQAEQ